MNNIAIFRLSMPLPFIQKTCSASEVFLGQRILFRNLNEFFIFPYETLKAISLFLKRRQKTSRSLLFYSTSMIFVNGLVHFFELSHWSDRLQIWIRIRGSKKRIHCSMTKKNLMKIFVFSKNSIFYWIIAEWNWNLWNVLRNSEFENIKYRN